MDSKLSLKQAAMKLGVSVRTVHRLMAAGRLQGEKKGTKWQFEQSAVHACTVRHVRRSLTPRRSINIPKGHITIRQLLLELPINSKKCIIRDIKKGKLPSFRYNGQGTYFIKRGDANAYKKKYVLAREPTKE